MQAEWSAPHPASSPVQLLDWKGGTYERLYPASQRPNSPVGAGTRQFVADGSVMLVALNLVNGTIRTSQYQRWQVTGDVPVTPGGDTFPVIVPVLSRARLSTRSFSAGFPNLCRIGPLYG
jgi:hypothetical protein